MTQLSRRTLLAAPAILPFTTGLARAQAPKLKVALVTTLSGPGGYLGADIRDAFKLVLDMNGGTLGGAPVELLVEDDGLKPAAAKQAVDRFYKSEGVRLFTGIVFSNVLLAAVPDLLENGDAVYVSPNAAPSGLAGKDCNRNYYVCSWQNDALHETAGLNANRLGYKRMMILAPNYAAGRDALTGFKRRFAGTIAGEIYTKLDQTDFATEMAQIRDAKPDAVFQFHPGGTGIAFVRQYQQAGLLGTVPMTVSESALDNTIVQALGPAAVGLTCTSHWNTDFDNPASRVFVAGFTKAYNRLPTFYAGQGYDTALAIAAALAGNGGRFTNAADFRTHMLPAKFSAVRGAFAFDRNQEPVQDWYALKVAAGADGKPALVTEGVVVKDYHDSYAAQCTL